MYRISIPNVHSKLGIGWWKTTFFNVAFFEVAQRGNLQQIETNWNAFWKFLKKQTKNGKWKKQRRDEKNGEGKSNNQSDA